MTPEQKKALAIAAARLRLQQQKAPQTSVPEQLGSGLNEGMAGFAGLPVDAATGAVNALVQRPTFDSKVSRTPDGGFDLNLTQTGMTPGIENPVGGSESLRGMMDPFISDAAPQSMPQRYARRIGQEAGFGVPAALATAAIPGAGAAARANMPAFMGASLAGDLGAGAAGQTAREIAPDSAMADIVASMLGGGAAAGAVSRMTPEYGPTPTTAELKTKANDLWSAVKAAPATLTDDATDALKANIRGALPEGQMAELAYPQAYGMAGAADTLKNPTIYDVEQTRRLIGDAVASNPQESRVGVTMKNAIADYLDGLDNSAVNGDVSGVVDDLAAARNTTSRVKRSEEIENAAMRGETRAATSGTGGNEVNAIRQNVRTIFDRERDLTKSGRRSGYSPEEMAAMGRVVMGSPGSNLARALGRFSPASGMLPAAFGATGLSGATAGLMTGNPIAALLAAPSAVGMVAKGAAENMTQKDIARLLATIRSGGKLPASTARNASQLAIVEQLLSTAAGAPNRPQ